MTPIELRLRNFMSYRDEARLDFTRLDVACFSGDNGAGKSALLDAITWSLWGKSRASSDRDVIAIGANEMEVTFTFALANREFRVFRRRTAGTSSRQSLEFEVREVGASDWVSITGDSVRQTERSIVETLNLDYETFVNSAFILQGRADSFSQIGPTDRKKILAEILNLSEYDALNQLARDDERSIRTQLSQVDGRCQLLDASLAERPARMAELEHASHQLTSLSEELDRVDELLKSALAQIAGWEQMHASLDRARARLERAQHRLSAVDDALSAAHRDHSERLSLVTDADAIERGASEHLRWRTESARMSECLLIARQYEQERNEAEREIERARSDLRQRLERVGARRDSLMQSLESRRQQVGQLSDWEQEERELERETGKLPGVRNELVALRDERSRLQAANGELKRRMSEIKESLDQINSGVAECPVCRSSLDEADRTRIAGEWQADGTQLGNDYRAHRSRIEDIDRHEQTLMAEESRVEVLDRSLPAIRERIAQARIAAEECDRIIEELNSIEVEREPLARLLDEETFAVEHRRMLATAVEQLAALGYDREAHDAAIAQERSLAHWENRKRDLDRARIELASIEHQLASLQQQRLERAEEAELATVDTQALEAQLADQPDVRRRADELRDTRDRIDFEKNEAQAAFGRAQGVLEELDRLAREREDVAERARLLSLDAGALRELTQAFGSNGIQAMIVESVLPEIEHEANEILRRMSSGALRVSFRSQREALSVDKMIETLDIIIRDEYGERPYALYSGGEAFRINFAVRVALSKLLAKRAGSRVDFLVIDEGFGSQDSRGRDGLIEALRSIEADFGTIIVITHLSEIRDLFPTRVEVTKTERGSTLTIVDS